MKDLLLIGQIAGEAALLLWGLHMVQSGVQRAFGSRLRRFLGVGLANRPRAFLSGLGATAVLQSSTATALMVGSFAASGAVTLVPALAAMLGANVGTALIVQVLSFDVAAVAPLLILVGVLAFRRAKRVQLRDLGRVAIGLGLMLLALHLMVESVTPLQHSPTLRVVLNAIASDPLPNLLIAAFLAWATHSSVAVVLFVGSLAGAGVLGPEAMLAMVVGANLGSAVNPVLEGGLGDPQRLRVPLGNLLNRVIGALCVLPFLPAIAHWLQGVEPSPARLVANAHLLFNLVTALVFMVPLPSFGRLLERLVPDRPPGADPGAPRYLDEAALDTPSVALANATREVLRMADTLEAMLRATEAAFRRTDREAAKTVSALNHTSERLFLAVLAYLARIPRDRLGEEEARRLNELSSFAQNLRHAAELTERSLMRQVVKLAKHGIEPSAAVLEQIVALHQRLLEQLRFAVAVFMMEDQEAARRLVAEKEAFRVAEREAAVQLAEIGPLGAAGASASLALDVTRDMKQIGAYLAATAHPLLERAGVLRESRLRDVVLSDAELEAEAAAEEP